MRSAEKPDVLGAYEAIRIAEIAASLTSSSLPRNTSAAVIARITSTRDLQRPAADQEDEQARHGDAEQTPPSSSKALRRRRP